MAIALMTKMKLVGLTFHEDEILNALQKTECVELSEPEEIAETFLVSENEEISGLTADYNRIYKAIEFYEEQLERGKTLLKRPVTADGLKNFFVTYDEFTGIEKSRYKLMKAVGETEEYRRKLAEIKTENVKLNNELSALAPYKNVKDNFSDYADTVRTSVFFGTVRKSAVEELKTSFSDYDGICFDVVADSDLCVVCVVALKGENAESAVKILAEHGFSPCPFTGDFTAEEAFKRAKTQIAAEEHEINRITQKVCDSADNLKPLKIFCDYYKYLVEKKTDAEKFRHTGKTFVLEGYLPRGKEETVAAALKSVSEAIFIEYSEPDETDNVPTLTVNNAAVKQTEFITDLYSVPAYGEVDPNKSVFAFFMVFMGLIMADVGYGILMILLGTFLACRIKVDNGQRRLWYVIAIGGVFTVIFGLLFNSFFGVPIFSKSLLPSPIPDGNGTDNLMKVLLGCLALGILHVATGYFLKALNCFKRKDVASGIFDGLVWVLFFIGLVFACFNFILGYLLSKDGFNALNPAVTGFFDAMTTPGLIMLVSALVIAALTAGRNEKGFGKVSKGFGAIYGIINLMSDILSYARLFGLILSGMIIATTFNDIGGNLISGGGIGYVAGPLVIAVGHAFNIAMGVLGAYIHDSRLQYIEFFSKFYTGEGEKFTPLGSETQFVYLTR